MAFLALAIGVVLLVAAIRNTHTDLFGALRQDVPGFAIWAAAIIALAAIGFVPGLKPVSRGLLALVVTVLILVNYKQILGGFTSAWQGAAKQGAEGSAPSGSSSSGLPDASQLLSSITAHSGDDLQAFLANMGGT